MTKLDESTEATASPVEHALRYVADQRWDVVPGTWLESEGGSARCSCGGAACASPGAHPAGRYWAEEATTHTRGVRELWAAHPHACVLLPTGRGFDVLDVPESAGLLALARLERLGAALGPVSAAPTGRLHFFARADSTATTPALLHRWGWTADALDLTLHAEGDWITAPPTRIGHRGPVCWVRRPAPAGRPLPEAEELLGPLAYACSRVAHRGSQ